jgi:hypothetical protein
MKHLWIFVFVTVILGCSEIVPGTCYENPAGGAGGADSLAVGAGVGATTSGGDYAEPPRGPLDYGDGYGDGDTLSYCIEDNPCVSRCPTGGPVLAFSPNIFKFVTTLADDGTAPAGGWQQASVSLKINRWVGLLPESWTCPQMTFGMPLRNEVQGKISAEMAASVSAELTTKIAHELKETQDDMPQGIFCFKLKEELKSRIGKAVKGARVTSP